MHGVYEKYRYVSPHTGKDHDPPCLCLHVYVQGIQAVDAMHEVGDGQNMDWKDSRRTAKRLSLHARRDACAEIPGTTFLTNFKLGWQNECLMWRRISIILRLDQLCTTYRRVSRISLEVAIDARAKAN